MVGVVGSAVCLPLSRQYMLLHCCAVEWSGGERERGSRWGVARPTGARGAHRSLKRPDCSLLRCVSCLMDG